MRWNTKFCVGPVFATARTLKMLSDVEIMMGVVRHGMCDWGEVTPSVWLENERAWRKGGGRLKSRYISYAFRPFWVVTSHFVTVVFLEDEVS